MAISKKPVPRNSAATRGRRLKFIAVQCSRFPLLSASRIPLPDNSVDVIISNCVINLSAD